jgi:group I intron endonuclease
MLIYCITNLINGKYYIGLHKGSCVESRWARHLWAVGSGSKTYIHNAIRKYGAENFEVQVLADGIKDEPLLKQHERLWIVLTRAHDPAIGYNMTIGGDGANGYRHTTESIGKIAASKVGKPLSAEHRAVLSVRAKARPPISVEMREMISKRNKGRKYPNRKPVLAETRAKMSAAQKGRKHSLEARRHMSIAQRQSWASDRSKRKPPKVKVSTKEQAREKQRKRMKGNTLRRGKTMPEEAKRRIAEFNKGRKYHGRKLSESRKKATGDFFRGRPFTAEHRAKISEARRKYWAERKGNASTLETFPNR